jgi:hypothetical protein
MNPTKRSEEKIFLPTPEQRRQIVSRMQPMSLEQADAQVWATADETDRARLLGRDPVYWGRFLK